MIPYLPDHLWEYIRKLEHKSRLKDTLETIEQLEQAKWERNIIDLAMEYIEHYVAIRYWDGFEWEKRTAIARIEFILNMDFYKLKVWKVPKWCETDSTTEYYKRLYQKCS